MKQLSLVLALLLLVACQPPAEEAPDHAARITKLYDAFAAGDMETVLANMADDVQWSEADNFIYDYGEPLVGKDAIVEGVFAKLGAEWEYWNLEDKKFQNLGTDGVLVTGRYRAKNKATGKLLDAQFAHVLKLQDTLLKSFQQYTDTKQAAEVVTMDAVEEEMEETQDS
ncbi:MAG: nuclear transport factor 2 family protein [Gilvibacter sp.]